MSNEKVVEVRVHTELLTEQKRKRYATTPPADKWSRSILGVDVETTDDQRQSILFGTYQYCRSTGSEYVPVEEGLFYADDLGPDSMTILEEYCKINKLRLLKQSKFLKKIFWPAVRAKALIVGFNLPFDSSRLASASCWTNRRGGHRNERSTSFTSRYADTLSLF